MPIYSLEGTPGSGKTLYAVSKIIPEFLKVRDYRGDLVPRHIYTNIAGLKPWLICEFCGIPYEAIADYFHVLGEAVDENGRTYEDKDLVRYWFLDSTTIEWVHQQNGNKQMERVPNWEKAQMIPRNSLVIIDEIQNYYSNRDFATNYSKTAIDFVTKNRHYGWTLWWLSQSVESVDVTFRRNTEQVYFLERLENYGRKYAASVKKYEGWLSGNKTNIEPFAKNTFSYDKRYFMTYKSYEDGCIKEKRYTTNVFLAHKGFTFMMVLLLIFIIIIIARGNPTKVLTNSTLMKPEKKTTATLAPPPTPATSFSGGGGGVVDTPLESVECYTRQVTANGITYIEVGGAYRPKDFGENIKKCGAQNANKLSY